MWNSHLLVTDFEADYGDPNEPLGPIRILAPCGGAGSGKVVVGSKSAIKGLAATVSELGQRVAVRGIAASAIQVRFAQPASYGWEGDYGLRGMSPICFDALHETAPKKSRWATPASAIPTTALR